MGARWTDAERVIDPVIGDAIRSMVQIGRDAL